MTTSKDEQLARNYALAYLNVNPQGITHKDIDHLEQCSIFFSARKDQLYFIHWAHASDEIKNEALVATLSKFHLSHLVSLIELLLKDRRIYLLPQVLEQLEHEYFKRAGIIAFDITSVTPLDQETKEVIEQFLAQKTKKKIRAHYTLDESLIAGMCFKSDGYIWEFSVRRELDRLRRATFMAQ